MDDDFLKKLYAEHLACPQLPSYDDVTNFLLDLMAALFPDYSVHQFADQKELEFFILNLKDALYDILYMFPNREALNTINKTDKFFEAIPDVYRMLKTDIKGMYDGDPAATSESEIIRSYPGFFAIAAYRIAHVLYEMDVLVIPRMITEFAHQRTGIDIHPGAEIGTHFCIDHGTGIVIGETSVIGDHVKIYQGVTLGALSVNKADADIKRHPTIEDHVVIYANATVLGGDTIIGERSIIGGNTWITKSLPADSKIYYQAQ